MMFKINNDIKSPQFTEANAFHFLASFALALFFGFWVAWGIGTLWEIGDGFKPWYWQAPPHIRNARPKHFWNWLKKEFCYSDKFSLQDWLIWDLLGACSGAIFRMMLSV